MYISIIQSSISRKGLKKASLVDTVTLKTEEITDNLQQFLEPMTEYLAGLFR